LFQSFPNPFTEGGHNFDFDMPVTEQITMFILDIRGRVVRTLINNEQRFCYQSVVWDAKNDDGDKVSSGVYFYQIRSTNFNAVGKLVFVK
jgi:Flagellar hook capping protein